MKTLLRNLIFVAFGLFFANSSAFAAQWVYAQGTNAVLEYPGNTTSTAYKGWGLDFVEKAYTSNWVHSSITTSGPYYQTRYIYVQYYKQYASASIYSVDLYNGGTFVKTVYPTNSSTAGWQSFQIDLGAFYTFYGLGVSMSVYPAYGYNTGFAIGNVAAYMQ